MAAKAKKMAAKAKAKKTEKDQEKKAAKAEAEAKVAEAVNSLALQATYSKVVRNSLLYNSQHLLFLSIVCLLTVHL